MSAVNLITAQTVFDSGAESTNDPKTKILVEMINADNPVVVLEKFRAVIEGNNKKALEEARKAAEEDPVIMIY